MPSCPPLSGVQNGALSRLYEELQALSTTNLMAVTIPLEALLGVDVMTKKAEYKNPTDSDLVIFQMQSYWRPEAIATEVAVNAIFTQFSPADLALVRLMNTMATLKLKDRKLEVIEGAEMPLSACHRSPLYFPVQAPLIIPPGITLEANFTLQDDTAAVVGEDSNYGLLLTGIALPRKV